MAVEQVDGMVPSIRNDRFDPIFIIVPRDGIKQSQAVFLILFFVFEMQVERVIGGLRRDENLGWIKNLKGEEVAVEIDGGLSPFGGITAISLEAVDNARHVDARGGGQGFLWIGDVHGGSAPFDCVDVGCDPDTGAVSRGAS